MQEETKEVVRENKSMDAKPLPNLKVPYVPSCVGCENKNITKTRRAED